MLAMVPDSLPMRNGALLMRLCSRVACNGCYGLSPEVKTNRTLRCRPIDECQECSFETEPALNELN